MPCSSPISTGITRRVANRTAVLSAPRLGAVSTLTSERAPSRCRSSRILRSLAAEVRADARFAGTQLLIEPGRYLVEEAGIYLARVNDIKQSRGKTFLIVDGGMNHHLAASGNLGQVIKRNFPVAVLNRLDAPTAATVDVVGPLCTPLDVIARDVALPAAQVGDLFGIFQSAYPARPARSDS
jgi:diaminopimelate decarboxylase